MKTKEEIKALLMSKRWESGPVKYRFLSTSITKNGGPFVQYDVKIETEKAYLINTGIYNQEPLLIFINDDEDVVTLSSRIDGDTGFRPMVLTQVQE